MAYLFEHRSEVILNAGPEDEERLLESLLELDADGYELEEAAVVVHGPFEALESLQDGLRRDDWDAREWGHHWPAQTSVPVNDPDIARSCLKLLDSLDGLDDVRSVSANLDLAEGLEID